MFHSLNNSSSAAPRSGEDSSQSHVVQERLECVALSLEDDTPPIRSLLCPAGWGALLESTTVSLVSTMRDHAWDSDDKVEPSECERVEDDPRPTTTNVLRERGVCTPDSLSGSGHGDDSKTPQGGQSPQRYVPTVSYRYPIDTLYMYMRSVGYTCTFCPLETVFSPSS